MSGKTRRAEKGVLSRQAIASRKRQIVEKKLQTGGVGTRVIAGVFALAFSVLTLLAVATFDAQDRTGPGFKNAVGPVGHALAEALRGAVGVCAFVLSAAGLWASMALLVGRARRRWPQLLSLALLTVSAAVLAQLAFEGEPGWAHPPGGALGRELGSLLSGLFSTVGTVILVTAVCVAALIVGTQFVFLRLCTTAWTALTAAFADLRRWAGAMWKAQKLAFEGRRQQAAQARLEESAFLAQLEADEEELALQEREAAEADAIAEEADRLNREAMKKRELEAQEKAQAKKLKEDAKRMAERAVPRPAATAVPEVPPAPSAAVSGVGEPAWVSALGSLPAPAEPDTPSAPAVSAPGRKLPQIITTASPKPESSPPTALVVARPPERTPVIIEPKAPPLPTTKKKEPDFQMLGGRTSFTLPPLDVLESNQKERSALDKEAFLTTAEKLRAKLADFGIVGEVVEIRPGPVVTMYEFLPGPGIKISKIASLADDLAMAMEAMRVRIVAPIPGKGVVGIEVPNKDREMVFLKEIAEQDAFTKSVSKITMCVGKDIEGMPYVLDLAKAPHLLIAGTTGSGKSVAVNAMIMSILLKSTPEEVRFIMVDPKMLELSVYEGIPHLLLPVVTDPKKAALALRWAVEEMERRYQLLADAGVRNIAGYNKFVENAAAEAKPAPRAKPPAPAAAETMEAVASARKTMIIDVGANAQEEEEVARTFGSELGVAAPRDEPEEVREEVGQTSTEAQWVDAEAALARAAEAAAAEPIAEAALEEEKKDEVKKLPYIVVIIDELADLMMVASREVEMYIARLAQMARAAGIHLMVATQRPSTDVVTGVIKANFPTRVSFMLRTKPDSMTILGTVGAEALLGMGDMLIMPPTSAHLQRVHGAYVSEAEIARVVDHLKVQGKPVYDENILKPREEDSEEGGSGEDELSDELYDQAMAVVADMKQVSISMLQRKMRIGYNRAARMIERMERDGVVGAADGARPREVLIRAVGEMPGAGAM